MFILGLTGSIGMGKSETAKMFRRLRVPVYDADAAVHELMAPGGRAVPLIACAFTGVADAGYVDRQALGREVFGQPDKLRRLEGIIHPLVRDAQLEFLRTSSRHRRRVVVLDIPLLFESGGDSRCDATVVVSAPGFLQAARVLARPGMTPEKFAGIKKQQMPDADKRQLADYIVPSGLGRAAAMQAVKHILADVRGRPAMVWPYRKRAG